jgi:condensin complex subunit 1
VNCLIFQEFYLNRLFHSLEANTAFKQIEHKFIFDHFDVFYSITERAKKLQPEHIFRAMDILYNSTDSLGNTLAEFLQAADSSPERHQMLNALKMHIFSTISLVKKIDKEVMINDGKKFKKNSLEEINNSKWEDKRYNALLQMFNIISLPLQNLWNPPVPEESFVNLCAEFTYRTLEHPTIKDKDTVENTVFNIFGVLLKSYNHSITFPIRIVELIRSNETSATAISAGLAILNDNFGITTIIKTVVTHLIESLDGDIADGPVIKNIALFFNELGGNSPALIMPHIRDLAGDVLDLDSHQLRICFIQLMSDIIVNELTGENLTQEQKELRDEYLDHLKVHVHDVNAHVRQKALQIWCRLKENDSVPLAWLIDIIGLGAGRLEDKSSLVRKQAIHLVKLFLEQNPYAAKLPIEELELRYEEKRAELSELRKKMNEESEKQEGISEQFDALIDDMKREIKKIVQLESMDDEHITSADCEKIYTEFGRLMEEKEHWKIVCLLRKNEELNGNWKEVAKMDNNLREMYIGELIRSHFLMLNQCKSYEEEYKTTECAVRFLEDSLRFSAVLVHAVPKLQEMLMSKIESDVNEAIDFFTSAFLFGIKNTEVGMRQLLYLVWSVPKDKRGPIKDAYKRILFDNDNQGR